jgi:ribosomal protein S18 acetylase RimI-like enzyme
MTILVRRARPGEEFAVSRLLAETWHDTHDAALGPEAVAAITRKWHAPALLRGEIEDPSRLFLVAETAEGGLAGHALAWLGEERRLNLLRLYVRPDCQGRGLGRRLLAAAVAAFPDAAALRLEVQAANARAIRFYERQGLAVIGDTGGKGGFTDVPALVMEKPLRRTGPGKGGTPFPGSM